MAGNAWNTLTPPDWPDCGPLTGDSALRSSCRPCLCQVKWPSNMGLLLAKIVIYTYIMCIYIYTCDISAMQWIHYIYIFMAFYVYIYIHSFTYLFHHVINNIIRGCRSTLGNLTKSMEMLIQKIWKNQCQPSKLGGPCENHPTPHLVWINGPIWRKSLTENPWAFTFEYGCIP